MNRINSPQSTLKLSENLSIEVEKEKKSLQFGHDHEIKLGDYPNKSRLKNLSD